jgi:hypothetical protein
VPVLRRILEQRYELVDTRSAKSALDLVLDGYRFDLKSDVRAAHPALASAPGDRILEKPIAPAALLAALDQFRARAAA